MDRHFISKEDYNNILGNQGKILKELRTVRQEFTVVDDLFLSCRNMLNSITYRLKEVDEIVGEIESYGSMLEKDNREKLQEIVRKADIIKDHLKIIKPFPQDIKDTVENIQNRINNVIKRNQTDKINPTDQKTIDLIIDKLKDKLDSVDTTINRIGLDLWKLKFDIDEVDNIIKSFNIADLKNNFIQMKEYPFGIAEKMTIGSICIVSILVALVFWKIHTHMAVVSACKNGNLNISFGIILIILALAGIWSLAFINIKSRLKIQEQDSMFFRKFFGDS